MFIDMQICQRTIPNFVGNKLILFFYFAIFARRCCSFICTGGDVLKLCFIIHCQRRKEPMWWCGIWVFVCLSVCMWHLLVNMVTQKVHVGCVSCLVSGSVFWLQESCSFLWSKVIRGQHRSKFENLYNNSKVNLCWNSYLVIPLVLVVTVQEP